MIEESSRHNQPVVLGLVAHDDKKAALSDWVTLHREALADSQIFATGTTGSVLEKACPELNIKRLKSGPLGGDQQLGAMICEGRLDALIFFIDPLSPLPHDVDVKALMRLATLYDIPHASNAATANLIAASLDTLKDSTG